MYSLHVRFGGLNIPNPVDNADFMYSSSREATLTLTEAIKGLSQISLPDHIYSVSRSRLDSTSVRQDTYNDLYSRILDNSEPFQKRLLERNSLSISSWLTAIPSQRDHYNLTSIEFRDALCLRYSKPLLQMPPTCDGCGSDFTVTHSLACKKGGSVTQRHNEVRDILHISLLWPGIS